MATAIATMMSVAVCAAARAADQRANRASSGARAAGSAAARPTRNMTGAARPVMALCTTETTAPAASANKNLHLQAQRLFGFSRGINGASVNQEIRDNRTSGGVADIIGGSGGETWYTRSSGSSRDFYFYGYATLGEGWVASGALEVVLISAWTMAVSATSSASVAILPARLVLGGLFTALGAVLAFDVKGAASKLHRANSGFTPWGRKLVTRTDFNPARLVGAFFLIGGTAALISVAVNP